MHRCFISSTDISGEKLEVSRLEDVHHLKDVLRVKPGEKLTACDEKGTEYLCSVVSVGETIGLRIENKLPERAAGRIFLTVACAVPKNVKMDDIVDKLTQIGVDRIIPLACARGEVKFNPAQAAVKLARWKRIAMSAAKQCQRNGLMLIEPVMNMRQALAAAENSELKLIGSLAGERKSLKDLLDKAQARSCVLFIGPEGDFTPEELALASEYGLTGISLGELVLRVDTAAVLAAGFIKLYANS